MLSLDDFDYELPEALIAQQPPATRSASRLLRLPRLGGDVVDAQFAELPTLLEPGDLLVANDTLVLQARLRARKPTGGRAEILVERVIDTHRALALVGTNKRVQVGAEFLIEGSDESATKPDVHLRVLARHDDLFELEANIGWDSLMRDYGALPLPPYIRRDAGDLDDSRYQTVFAARPGAVAAPTAGLHFDAPLLAALESAGVGHTTLTLHVGAGTFQPVRGTIAEHKMHRERYVVSPELVAQITATRRAGGRVIAVGTTVVRALESAARAVGTGELTAGEGDTELFITPGFEFRVVDGLITNFHLPKTTLMMLVSAFSDRERLLGAYRHAVAAEYRFFSYGDAMLIL